MPDMLSTTKFIFLSASLCLKSFSFTSTSFILFFSHFFCNKQTHLAVCLSHSLPFFLFHTIHKSTPAWLRLKIEYGFSNLLQFLFFSCAQNQLFTRLCRASLMINYDLRQLTFIASDNISAMRRWRLWNNLNDLSSSRCVALFDEWNDFFYFATFSFNVVSHRTAARGQASTLSLSYLPNLHFRDCMRWSAFFSVFNKSF